MAYFNGKHILFSAKLQGSLKLPAIIKRSITKLKPLDFEGIGVIGAHAFRGCESLASVEFGNKVYTIGQYAFSECPALSCVIISDSVIKIDKNAFNDRGNMVVTIGNGITEIGARAFFTLTASHLEMHIKATTPPTLASGALGTASSLTHSIVVPAGCGEAYKAATNWARYADYITEESV